MTQIYANNFTTLSLGRQGENLARQVVFDLSAWEAEYGPGTAELIAQRPGDETPYPVETTRDGDSVVWTVTSADTLYPGDSGRCELRYYVGETLAKSRIWGTYVARAMDTPSETTPPEPEQGWVDQIIAVGAAAKASADAAKADADRAAALAAQAAEKAAQTAQDASDAAKAMEAAQTAQRLAEEAQGAAETARTAAETAQAAAEQSATDAAGAKQDAETALESAQDAAAAAAKALADIRTLYQEMQTWAQGVIQDVHAAGSAAVQSVQTAGDTQVQRVTDEGTTQTANAKAQADAAALSASGAAQSAHQAAESAAVYDTVVADVTQLKQDVEHLAPTIVCKSSGNAITLDDSSNRPFSGLNLYGKTTQDGTPSPDSPVPLVSVGDSGSVVTTVCGKNLFADGKVYLGGLNDSYGQISIGYPVESPVHRIVWAGVGIRVAVSPNNTYTVSSDITPCKYFTVTFYKDFDSVGSKANAISFKEFTNRNNATFTTPENCYCVVITSVSNVESDFTWSWWQVEHGSAATVYEPYEGQTLSISTPNGLPGIPVSSGGNYTDASGQQWICDEVDFERGVYVQRVLRKLFDGSEEWIDGGTINGNVRPTNTLSEIIVKAPNPGTKISSFCDFYQLRSSLETWEEKIGYSVSDKSNSIQFYNSNFTTLSSWKAYLAENPVTCLLQLASPIETALSEEELAAYVALRTNYPNTTIINDSAAWMGIGYQADTKLYIDKQFAELKSAIISLGGNV